MAEAAAAVEERRVRPVYDAIDAGNHKLAFKLMAQHERKHGDASGLIRALRALVLERSGKPEEAFALCEEVRGLKSLNEHVLNTLLMVYKATGHLQQATDCMEQVSKVTPNDTELISRLFQAYLRQYRFRDMQLAALKLYRIKPDEQHLMWAVTSAFLEAGSGDLRALQLAETMVRKHRQKQELQLTQSLLVYLDILKASGKLEEALSMAEQLGSLFSIQVDRLRVQASLQVQLGKKAEAAATYAKLLDINLDDWSAYMGYFESTLPSITARIAAISLSSDSSLGNNNHDRPSTTTVNGNGAESNAWTAASELVNKLQQRADGGNEIQRGPFLAQMELSRRKIECEGTGQQELVDAIVVYFKRFGQLVSFGKDSERAVAAVSDAASKDRLLKALHDLAGSADDDSTELNVKSLRRLISVREVERQMGLYRSGVLSTSGLLSLYSRTLGLSADLDERECGHGDHFITIAATSMVDLFMRHQEPKYMLAAIWLLELGLARSRYNYVFRLALLSLYEHLAAAGPALATWEPLEIKHIQLDTLSHHILPVLQAGPYACSAASWGSLRDLLKGIMKFHSDYRREAADLVMTAFRHGSFNKVKEFVDFKTLLETSHQRAVAIVESTLLKLQEKCHSLPDSQAVLAEADFGREAEALYHQHQSEFTEDVTTRQTWHPYPNISLLTSAAGNACSEEEWQSRATQALRSRSLLPRMFWLISSITMAADDEDGKSTKLESSLMELLKISQQWLRRTDALDAAAVAETVSKDQEQATEPSVTAAVLAAGVALLKGVSEPGVAEHATVAARALQLVDAAFAQQTQRLCGLLGEATPQGSLPDLYVSPRCGEVMAQLNRHAHENTAWLLLCAQAWSKALQPSSKGKTKKKKGSTAQLEPNHAGSNLQAALHDMLKAVSSSLEELAGKLQAQLSISADVWLKEFLATLDQLDDTLLASIKSLQSNAVDGTESGRNRIEGVDAVGVFSPVVASQRSVLERARDVVLSRNAALLALTRTG